MKWTFLSLEIWRRSMRCLQPIIISVSLWTVTASVRAQLSIDVGDHTLLPNVSGQSFDLLVQTGASDVQVAALVFNVQIANGIDTPPAPTITGANIVAGTVFDGLGSQMNVTTDSHFWNVNFTVPAAQGTVTLAHDTTTKIGTVTVDTTGFSSPMTWALNLANTRNLTTHYLDNQGTPILPTITDGHISVVPEPNASFAVCSILLCLAVFWRRKRSVPPEHVC
jgi:hypothetical protein